MAPPRFLVEDIPEAGGRATLDREEARHALGSRRLGAGDAVDLVDGRGTMAVARIDQGRNHAGQLLAEVVEVRRIARPRPAIHVGTAVPKGDRLATLLDAAGELAIETLVPLDCERGIVPPERLGGERAERILSEAMKQSRGVWLTRIEAPATPEAFAREALAAGRKVLVLDPEGAPLVDAVRGSASIALLIGPEGGFSATELSGIREAGAERASLGAGILRVEVALSASCGAIRAAHPSGPAAQG
jgi:16S rRNA (uracil1498-N3)-methyltransferase